jgi:hypothetical protein
MTGLAAGAYSILGLVFLVYFLVPFKHFKKQKQTQVEQEQAQELFIEEPPQRIPFTQKKPQLNSWRTDGYEYSVSIPENPRKHPDFVETTTEGVLPYWLAFGLPESWKVANTTGWDKYKPFFYEPLPGDNVYYTVNDLLENRKNKLL